MIYYFAHPYSVKYLTGTENMVAQEENVMLCVEACNNLMEKGFVVFAPIVQTHFMHKIIQRPYHVWIGYDQGFMDKMDGLILAHGWEKSKGCVAEKRYFDEKKLPILYYDDIMKVKEIKV